MVRHTNFFENRVTEYEVAGLKGSGMTPRRDPKKPMSRKEVLCNLDGYSIQHNMDEHCIQ